jgi:hypothetical protein
VPDVRIHDLRRTLGSWLAASGHSLPLIGKALNHSNESTTAIYARLQLDSVREALEHNAEAMFGSAIPLLIDNVVVVASADVSHEPPAAITNANDDDPAHGEDRQ